MGQGYSRAEVRRRPRNVPASPSTSSDASDSDEGTSRTSRKKLSSSSANLGSTISTPKRKYTQSTPYQRWIPTQDTYARELQEWQKGRVPNVNDTSSWHPNPRNPRQRSSTSQLQTDPKSIERDLIGEQQPSDRRTGHLRRPAQVVERWIPQHRDDEDEDHLGLLLKNIPQIGELDIQDWERRLRGSEPVTDDDEDATESFTDDDEDVEQNNSSLSISPTISTGLITAEDGHMSEQGLLSDRRLKRNVEQQRDVSNDHNLPKSTQRTRETELLNHQRIPEMDLRELMNGESDDEGWSEEKTHSQREREATTVDGQTRPLEPNRKEWQHFLEDRRTHELKERRIKEEELKVEALEAQRRKLREREEELRYLRLCEERLEEERKRKGEFEEREDTISEQTRELEPRREELQYLPGEQEQLGPGEEHPKEEEITETERIEDQREKEVRLRETERRERQLREETLALEVEKERRQRQEDERKQEEERERRETERRREVELERDKPANPEQTRQLELLRKEAALMEERYLLEEQRKLELEEQRTREEFRSMNEVESRTEQYRKEEQLRKGEDALKEEEMMHKTEEALAVQREILSERKLELQRKEELRKREKQIHTLHEKFFAKLAQEAEFQKQRSLLVQHQLVAEMRRRMEDELAAKEKELSERNREMEEWKRRRHEDEIAERTRKLELLMKKEAELENQHRLLLENREAEAEQQRRTTEELTRKTQEPAERLTEEWRFTERRQEAPVTARSMHQLPTQAAVHRLWRPDRIRMREPALNENQAVDDEGTAELDEEGALEHRKEKKSSENGQTALEQEFSGGESKDEVFRAEESLEGAPREDSNPLTAVAPEILAELAHLDLSHSILFKDTRIVGDGTYGDVSIGNCTVSGQRKVKIAIKRLRFWWKRDIKTLFEREIYVWSRLKHPNILPLLGFAVDDSSGYPLLISEWMENGSAWEYVTRNPSCNVMDLVIGIASGLAYLHSLGIVHSDIKSDNIMISDLENALICDFGCSRMVDSSRTYARLTSSVKGTSRYLAYELVVAPDLGGEVSGSHTTKTDVWAFGMTVFELFTHERPYANLLDTQVVYAIMKRSLPQFPSAFASSIESGALSGIKRLCNDCWKHDSTDRPSMQSVLDELRRICHIDPTQAPA
ncbi:hypothetical protein ACEPAH_3143 [Sanghuangporus vaninii]